jgi:aminoglycoside 3-N-acetyltransferase
MVTYRDLVAGFRRLGLRENSRVIAHASLSAFGEIIGGADTMVGALVGTFESVVMPAFTYRTMVTPPLGPSENALAYGADLEKNKLAEFYRPALPADRAVGVVAESLRLHPEASRSNHPILSFSGVNAQAILEVQMLEDPLGLIGALAEADGDILLLGVDQRANVSIHYAERLAGRRQFTRWALTPNGVVECPGIPGCSDGFNVLNERLSGIRRQVTIGAAKVQALPLRDLLHLTVGWIRENPQALLCQRPNCARCNEVRSAVTVNRRTSSN